MVLYLIYTAILLYVTIILALEFIRERDWRRLVPLSMVLLIFMLRLLQIK